MSNTSGLYGDMVGNYFTAPTKEDSNLVELTASFLEEYVDTFAKNCFLNDPDIKSVYNLTSSVQRYIINKYFSKLLLLYRSTGGMRVDAVITMLSDDGNIDDWVQINKVYLYPFLAKIKIFDILYRNGEADNDSKNC